MKNAFEVFFEERDKNSSIDSDFEAHTLESNTMKYIRKRIYEIDIPIVSIDISRLKHP